MVSAKHFPLSCPEKLFYACHNPKSASSKLHQNVICLSCLSLFTFNIGNEANSMDPAQIAPTVGLIRVYTCAGYQSLFITICVWIQNDRYLIFSNGIE